MSEWGGYCVKCGHPAGYHGVTFCMVDAGGAAKKRCDCDGWTAPHCECGWTGVGNHYHDSRQGGVS